MQLPSQLDQTTLGDLLGTLHRAQVSGALELHEPSGRVSRICLRSGTIERVEAGVGRRLGDVLRARGALDGAQQRELERCAWANEGTPLGEVLLRQASFDPAVLGAALSEQMMERLEYLFSIARARIVFRALVPALGGVRVFIGAKRFLAGRPRRRARQGQSADPSRRDAGSWDVSRRAASPGAEVPLTRREACKLLGIPEHANQAGIRRAFRLQAARVHPDKCPSADDEARAELTEQFRRINDAYRTLLTTARD